MEMKRNSKRNLAIGFAILMALSSILVNHVAAAKGRLNLPSTLVWIEVSDGKESYFNTKLSNAPSDYDVTNETYPSWCVNVKS